MTDIEVELVDARGLHCPEPVMLLHAAIRRAAPGALIRLLATDPSTRRDVPNFCRFLDHELCDAEHEDDEFAYTIRKVSAEAPAEAPATTDA